MAEPFVFNFKPGPDSEPLQMYICDALGACKLCRADHIQRFYHAASFHKLSVDRLQKLADDCLLKLDAECRNCGETLTPAETKSAVLIWGFADDAGTLTAWVTPAEETRWLATANRRLDPQALPGFAPPAETEALTDDLVERKLSRVVNPKHLWIELFDHVDEEPGIAYENAGRDFLMAVGDEPLDEFFESVRTDDQLVVALDDLPIAPFLPLHDSVDALFAGPTGWLSASRLESVSNGERFAAALISPKVIRDTIERAFAVGNLTYVFDDETATFRTITTPTEIVFEHDLAVLAVAQRAVYTGITPGESARLTAEEIVGTLLRVWE